MDRLSNSSREQLYGLHIGAEQMAFLFGITTATVYRWSRIGKLPATLPYTSKNFWRLGDVISWMASHQGLTQWCEDRRAERQHKRNAESYIDSLRTPEQREAHRKIYSDAGMTA